MPVPAAIKKILTAGPDERKPKDERSLRTFYLSHVRERRQLGDRLAKPQAEKRAIVNKIPSTMVRGSGT